MSALPPIADIRRCRGMAERCINGPQWRAQDSLRVCGTSAVTLPLTGHQISAKFVAFASAMATPRKAATSDVMFIGRHLLERQRQRTSGHKRGEQCWHSLHLLGHSIGASITSVVPASTRPKNNTPLRLPHIPMHPCIRSTR